MVSDVIGSVLVCDGFSAGTHDRELRGPVSMNVTGYVSVYLSLLFFL